MPNTPAPLRFAEQAKQFLSKLDGEFDQTAYLVLKMSGFILLSLVALNLHHLGAIFIIVVVLGMLKEMFNQSPRSESTWKDVPRPPLEDKRVTLKEWNGRFVLAYARNGQSVPVVPGALKRRLSWCSLEKRASLIYSKHAARTTVFELYQRSVKSVKSTAEAAPWEGKAVRSLDAVKEHRPCHLKVDVIRSQESEAAPDRPLVLTATPDGTLEFRTFGDGPETWQKFILLGAGTVAPSLLTCHGYFVSTANLPRRLKPAGFAGRGPKRRMRSKLKIMFAMVLAWGMLSLMLYGTSLPEGPPSIKTVYKSKGVPRDTTQPPHPPQPPRPPSMDLEQEIKKMKREMAQIRDQLQQSKGQLESEREARLKAEEELRNSFLFNLENTANQLNSMLDREATAVANMKRASEDAQDAIERAIANAKDAIRASKMASLNSIRQDREDTLNEIARAANFAKTDVEGSTGHLSKRMMKEIHKKLGDKVEGARKGLKKEARRLAESIRDARRVRETLENVAKRAKHAGGRLRGVLGGLFDNISEKVDRFDRWARDDHHD